MRSFVQDLRYAVRSLVKQPCFTIVALVTLALGIGANTAIFGVVNAVLLRPLPYREPPRVVMMWSHWINWNRTWLSEPELADYRAQASSLEDVSAFQYTSFNLTGIVEPQRVRAATVQASLFDALGVQPILGRVFTADEDRPGRARVALLGEPLWRAQFGADPSIVGRTIELDGAPYTVLGVMPAAAKLPIDFATRATTDLWVPIALGAPDPNDRGNHGLFALARLKPGATLEQAQAEIDTITRGFRQAYPGLYDREFGLTLVTAPSQVFGEIRPALVVLLLAVGLVLLIACANVANLLLARADARQKEIAIRIVLGAGRARLVRQLLTESLALAGAGAALGVGVAWALVRLLAGLDPLKIPRVADVAIDARVLAFTAAAAVATGVLFGLAPALRASGADPQPALKAGGRDSRGGGAWLRRGLVVGEIAASVVLVAAAALMARSFVKLLDVRAGFNPSHVLTLRTSLPDARYPTGTSMGNAYRAIGARLRAILGVDAAGAVTGLPLASTRGDWRIVIEGRPVRGHIPLAADWQVITPGYFEALGTPLAAGRFFDDRDLPGSLPVVIVNETMAATFWPGENALGRRFTMGRNDRWLTIVGLVSDVHHRGLDEPARPELYRPHAQFRFGGTDAGAVPAMTWVLRTRQAPESIASAVRAAVRDVDAGLGISDVMTMDEVVADSTSDRRLNLLLFALLGGLALALASVGVYGVVAYSVGERTHEIGVRMAIGARAADVERMVLTDGLRLAAAGVALGSALALALTRLIRGLLFEVSATDPATFVAVAAGLIVVAMLASYVPARRATRVDPMTAIRGE